MRRILITGANKGIGLAIATAILQEHDDAFVVLGSRDLERGRLALAGLLKKNPEWAQRAVVLEIDVSSDDSVARAATQVREMFAEEETPLYALVNNAGIGLGVSELAAVLEVNTVGMRRVCDAFLPLLDAANGRIVNTTSASGPNFVAKCSEERQQFFLDPTVEWEGIAALMNECLALSGPEEFAEKGLGSGDAYGLSKACANSYTLMLARKFPNLKINAFTPGFIETDLTRPYAEAQNKSPEQMGMKPPAAGARTALFLLFGEPEGNGHYYGSDGVRSPLHCYRAPGDPPYTGRSAD